MSVVNSAQSVLLLSEQDGTVLPYSTGAFLVSSGPMRRVLQMYVGALVVYRDSSVSRLDGIQFLGLWGNNAWERAFSFANGGVRKIAVTFRPLPNFSFEEIRRLTVECVRRHPEVLESYFGKTNTVEEILNLLHRSSTCEELFEALDVPAPEDALDSLG